MATLYPLDRKSFLYRLGAALRDTRLANQLLGFLDHSGERTKVAVLTGSTAGDYTVTGIATNDRLIAVHAHSTTAHGPITDHTSEFTITAANTINNTGGTDLTDNNVIVYYGDRSP